MKISIGAPIYDEREIRAVVKALREERLSQGKYVLAFERSWADYVGRDFGIGANSGSSANLIAVAAMKEYYGWKDGDFVLVPALTFATAVMPVLQMRLRPAWVDVDANGNMTLENIRQAVRRYRKGRMRGIVVVHSLGVPVRDILKIRKWARARRLPILEDACESHGAKVGDTRVGGFGDVSTSSFYVAHNMTTGEGGMITTDNKAIADICRSLREFGRDIASKDRGLRYAPLAGGDLYDVRYVFNRLGYNMRMTDITASFGLVQLAKLERMNAKRRRIVNWYRSYLDPLIETNCIELPREHSRCYNTYYAMQITFKNMPARFRGLANIAAALEARGIETRPFMGGNLLRQRAFVDGTPPARFVMADFVQRRSLLIGCHPLLTRVHVSYVCREIAKLYAR